MELRDVEGNLLASSKAHRKLASLHDGDGRLAVTFKPEVKGIFSVRNVLSLAISSIFTSDSTRMYRPGSRVNSSPPLNLTALPGSVIFASIVPSDDGTQKIDLLPPGTMNDRAVARAVDPTFASRLRSAGPLTLTRGADGIDILHDSTGRLIARAIYDTSNAGRPADDGPESVDVHDNSLPSVWLYAIFLGCRHWHR